MFFLLKDIDIVNYADSTIPSTYGENIESVIKLLEQSANLLFNWFKNNQMKDNEDRFHVLLNTDETVQVNKCTNRVNNGKCEKLLGIKIDCEVSFDDRIGNMQKGWCKIKCTYQSSTIYEYRKKRS